MKKGNCFLTIFLSTMLIFCGMILNFVIHEFSHAIVLILCNGSLMDLELTNELFVSGYTETRYIAIIALASIYIPLGLSVISMFLKNKYVNIFYCGFTLPIFINCLLGLIAFVFEKNETIRKTYDFVLAMENCSSQFVVCAITVLMMIFSLIITLKNLISFAKSI